MEQKKSRPEGCDQSISVNLGTAGGRRNVRREQVPEKRAGMRREEMAEAKNDLGDPVPVLLCARQIPRDDDGVMRGIQIKTQQRCHFS